MWVKILGPKVIKLSDFYCSWITVLQLTKLSTNEFLINLHFHTRFQYMFRLRIVFWTSVILVTFDLAYSIIKQQTNATWNRMRQTRSWFCMNYVRKNFWQQHAVQGIAFTPLKKCHRLLYCVQKTLYCVPKNFVLRSKKLCTA